MTVMDLSEVLQQQNAYWDSIKRQLNNEDIKALCGKRGLDWLLDVFSKAHAKREKLVKEGEIGFGYCFKECLVSGGDPVIPTWVLVNPSLAKTSLDSFRRTAGALLELGRQETKLHRKEQIYWKIRDSLAKASYFEIPPEYSSELMTLSVVERRVDLYPNFHLGLNIFFQSRSISPEIWLVPEKYFCSEWRKIYFKEDDQHG